MRETLTGRAGRPQPRAPGATPDVALLFSLEEERDRNRLRWALGAALLLHVLLLASRAPEVAATLAPPERRELIVVQTFGFRPPEPLPEVVREPRSRRVPVPDPTPEEPEPIRPFFIEAPPLDFGEVLVGIPEAPPTESDEPTSPRPVGGEIAAPRQTFAPPPAYTEIARRARIQGLVVVRATIDPSGRVVDARVEKGLGFGLDETALEAVRRWTFEPATLRGRPVAVYYTLNIRFELR